MQINNEINKDIENLTSEEIGKQVKRLGKKKIEREYETEEQKKHSYSAVEKQEAD